MSELSSNAAPPAAVPNKDDILYKKVKAYKRVYRFLMLTGILMLVLVIIYIIWVFSASKKLYQPMDNSLTMGESFAVDSSGKMIAFAAYNIKDSTISIMVSTDSGRHFELKGGPWKNIDGFNGIDGIRTIQIATDNKSIVAAGREYVYLKAADADSFTCIKPMKFPDAYKFGSINGFCFVPGTDSVYVYHNEGDVYCLNYKKYDSLAIGRLKGISNIESMSVNNKEIIVINSNNDTAGIYANNYFELLKKYAVAEYNDKEGSLDEEKFQNAPADTAKVIMRDSLAKMKK